MEFGLSVVGIMVLVYAGVCASYYLLQERLIFVRNDLSDGYRFKFQFPFEERFVEADDRTRLHALYFPPEEGITKGVVLYFHGNTGTLRRWGRRAPRFTRLGWAVLMPDPRGYGKSRGKLSEAALLADAWTWYGELCKEMPETDIVLYGRSLGCALAIPTAGRGRPKLLLLEAPFARLIDAARHYFRWLPYGLLLRYTFDNCERITDVQCPIYIFHGEKDAVVPFSSALRLYSCIPSDRQRELIAFPKGHHSDLARFVRFNRKVRTLLGE
ncbi:MAG: alpha/beta hydrolase [Flavobacteriales bacterium]|nr:alpha/beta hydrolase [Flavobacteriales bacterium]MBP6696169.1 alpha/beta hydrolase [Flavobacteriales bacterium]